MWSMLSGVVSELIGTDSMLRSALAVDCIGAPSTAFINSESQSHKDSSSTLLSF